MKTIDLYGFHMSGSWDWTTRIDCMMNAALFLGSDYTWMIHLWRRSYFVHISLADAEFYGVYYFGNCYLYMFTTWGCGIETFLLVFPVQGSTSWNSKPPYLQPISLNLQPNPASNKQDSGPRQDNILWYPQDIFWYDPAHKLFTEGIMAPGQSI